MGYNPNQPRDPAGTSTGGQWSAEGASALDDKDKAALRGYTEEDYHDVNRALREGVWDDGTRGKIEALDRAFIGAELEEGATLYRGFSGDAATYIRATARQSAVISDKGFVSTSLDEAVAQSNANRGRRWGREAIVMRIFAPARANGINVSSFSQFPGEREVVLNRSSRFAVRGWSEDGFLDVDLLP